MFDIWHGNGWKNYSRYKIIRGHFVLDKGAALPLSLLKEIKHD